MQSKIKNQKSLNVFEESSTKIFQNHLLINPFYQNLSEQVKQTFLFDSYITSFPSNTMSIKFDYKAPLANPKKKGIKKCQKIIKDKAYICFDCRKTNKSVLCQSCFYAMGHQRQCNYTIENLPEVLQNCYTCSCGNPEQFIMRGTDEAHHLHQFTLESSLTVKEKVNFVTYFTGCFKMLFSLLHCNQTIKDLIKIDQWNHIQSIILSYGQILIQILTSINAYTNQYIQLTSSILLTKIGIQQLNQVPKINQKQDQTILSLLLFYKILLNEKNMKLMFDIFETQNQSILKQYTKTSFRIFNNGAGSTALQNLISAKNRFLIQPNLICKILRQITNEGFQVKKNEQQTFILSFFLLLQSQDMFLKQENKHLGSLLPCWKQLRKNAIFTIKNIHNKISSSSICQFLSFIVSDEDFFAQMIKQFIEFIIERLNQKDCNLNVNKKKIGKKINLIQSTNLLIKSILTYLDGQIEKIGQYLYSLQVNQNICLIVTKYFNELIEKPHSIDKETILSFGQFLFLLKMEKIQDFNNIWKIEDDMKLQTVQAFIQKVTSTLMSQQLQNISKIDYFRSHKKAKELLQLKQRKLKQFLSRKNKIHRRQLEKLKSQNILNFMGATQIIQKYTRYDQSTEQFIYSSDQNYVSYDEAFKNIWPQFVPQSINFDPEIDDKRFNGKNIKQTILGMLEPLLIQSCLHENIVNDNTISEYRKWFCLIIMDKIVNGQVKQLRNQLYEKKRQIQSDNLNNQEQKYSKGMKLLFKLSEIKAKQINRIQKSQIHKVMNPQKQNQKLRQIKNENKTKQLNEELNIQNQHIVNINNCKPIAQKQKQQTTQKNISILAKKQKLNEKFLKKREKFLQKSNYTIVEQIVENRQACMICKQHGTANNSLYNLGHFAKQNAFTQILNFYIKEDFTFSFCQHVIHQTCFLNLAKDKNFTCPLCRKNSNFLIPLEQGIRSESARQFTQNRFIYLFIQNYNDYHRGSCFVFLFKSLVTQTINHIIFSLALMTKQIRTKNKYSQEKKIHHICSLLSTWWSALMPYQQYKQHLDIKKKFIESFISGEEQNKKAKIQGPLQLIETVVYNIIWVKVTGRVQMLSSISKKIGSLQRQLPNEEFEIFNSQIRHLFKQIVFDNCIENTQNQQDCKQGDDKKQSFIKYYFKAPHTCAELSFLGRHCKKCNSDTKSQISYLCLLCGISFCAKCDHSKDHNGVVVRISCLNGNLYLNTKKQPRLSEFKIYKNTYMQDWGVINNPYDNLFDYRLNYDCFYDAMYSWIRKIISQTV